MSINAGWSGEYNANPTIKNLIKAVAPSIWVPSGFTMLPNIAKDLSLDYLDHTRIPESYLQ